ncbi:hypothetical protein ANN_18159 [Periplaneta americana]|uniref:Uncharacterized protein n=1 Tax=Periplaneta americana TaxID=6978 RepID=A0ABQ8SNJ5_PERAM|nr:hypothetical protein ANN_18159 [Periplaneta americana]
MFAVTYVCEKLFSTMKIVKIKFRSRLTDKYLRDQLRLAVFSGAVVCALSIGDLRLSPIDAAQVAYVLWRRHTLSAENSFNRIRTDRLDTATCTHTLLSTDVHIRTDHVRYTLRYLHCLSVVSCPHPSDSALNGMLSKTAYTVIVATVRSKNMFAFSSDERAFNIESFSHRWSSDSVATYREIKLGMQNLSYSMEVFLQKFSRYKNCLSDRRRRFSFDNLREYIVVYCNAVLRRHAGKSTDTLSGQFRRAYNVLNYTTYSTAIDKKNQCIQRDLRVGAGDVI